MFRNGATSVSAVDTQTNNTGRAQNAKTRDGLNLSLRACHSCVRRNKGVTHNVKDGSGAHSAGDSADWCLKLALSISMVLRICRPVSASPNLAEQDVSRGRFDLDNGCGAISGRKGDQFRNVSFVAE